MQLKIRECRACFLLRIYLNQRIKNSLHRYGYFRSNKHSMDIRRGDTRCFRIGVKYQAQVGERGSRGLDFAKTRGWKATRRADCSRREENNANNGRDVALRWARAYVANTITLWTRLPFKWKQTWNAKIHQRARPRNARNRASTPLDHRYANCARALYTELFYTYRKIFHARILWWMRNRAFFLSNNTVQLI